MLEEKIKLETRLVGDIEGKFYVPSYQRGYRWGKNEVTRLLEDIYSNGENNYCLQPIVVRARGEHYELIDGQQRLTTIYLIYNYMYRISKGFLGQPKFSLVYQTRVETEKFLEDIDLSRKEENIDFWFLCDAYETIENWFKDKERVSTLTRINQYFDENIKVIWYEVDKLNQSDSAGEDIEQEKDEEAIKLFTRLNIGKIPLTSAELVKAMFLNSSGIEKSMDRQEKDTIQRKQKEISLQWDNIERELHNESLWYFLTNHSRMKYKTRIDLILNLISEKPENEKEEYYTFFYFDKCKETDSLDNIWNKIQHTFLILKDWFEDHNFYHKIGYIITAEVATLQEIFNISQGITKDEFDDRLDKLIKNSIKSDKGYEELNYENSSDYEKINGLLLLFNVISVKKNGEKTQWFPFDKFKFNGEEKIRWSLEHIHAQNSEGLRTESAWKEWLRLHEPSVEAVTNNSELLLEMQNAAEKKGLRRHEFEAIREKVVEALSAKGSVEYMHSISNLALLNTSDNAVLSNSTFDVKRNLIIEMDKKGQYIPFCTKMVFLKYYTPSIDNQLHFWGIQDRVSYVETINNVLEEYLEDEISTEGEVI
jgi:uncharacterized protein with ParB-like and HNH nuclease domain